MSTHTFNIIESSREEYAALLETEWRKDYFNEENGGYLVTSWKRIEQALKSNLEGRKYAMEHHMCLVFAKAGCRIKHLPDNKPNHEGSYDVICDEMKADLKKTRSTNNVIKYASRAVKTQGASIILFEFEIWDNGFREVVDELVRKGYHGRYFISGEQLIHQF